MPPPRLLSFLFLWSITTVIITVTAQGVIPLPPPSRPPSYPTIITRPPTSPWSPSSTPTQLPTESPSASPSMEPYLLWRPLQPMQIQLLGTFNNSFQDEFLLDLQELFQETLLQALQPDFVLENYTILQEVEVEWTQTLFQVEGDEFWHILQATGELGFSTYDYRLLHPRTIVAAQQDALGGMSTDALELQLWRDEWFYQVLEWTVMNQTDTEEPTQEPTMAWNDLLVLNVDDDDDGANEDGEVDADEPDIMQEEKEDDKVDVYTNRTINVNNATDQRDEGNETTVFSRPYQSRSASRKTILIALTVVFILSAIAFTLFIRFLRKKTKQIQLKKQRQSKQESSDDDTTAVMSAERNTTFKSAESGDYSGDGSGDDSGDGSSKEDHNGDTTRSVVWKEHFSKFANNSKVKSQEALSKSKTVGKEALTKTKVKSQHALSRSKETLSRSKVKSQQALSRSKAMGKEALSRSKVKSQEAMTLASASFDRLVAKSKEIIHKDHSTLEVSEQTTIQDTNKTMPLTTPGSTNSNRSDDERKEQDGREVQEENELVDVELGNVGDPAEEPMFLLSTELYHKQEGITNACQVDPESSKNNDSEQTPATEEQLHNDSTQSSGTLEKSSSWAYPTNLEPMTVSMASGSPRPVSWLQEQVEEIHETTPSLLLPQVSQDDEDGNVRTQE